MKKFARFMVCILLIGTAVAVYFHDYIDAFIAMLFVFFYQLEQIIDKKTVFQIIVNKTTIKYEVKNKRKTPAAIPEVHGKPKRTYPRNLQGRFAKAE